MLPHSSTDVSGTLYIVATPIGNLDDLSKRAKETLEKASYIAAEDTRHTKKLLNFFNIEARLFSLHDHNEKDRAQYIAKLLDEGEDIALVSDAGTPLISDPGYHVVSHLRDLGYKVSPVPGPSAIITALCASGLPTDKFFFQGFLPAKSKSRKDVMQTWKQQTGTTIFYESTHRINDSITDLMSVFDDDVELVLARELTKTFETFLKGKPSYILQCFEEDSNQMRGEFVVMVDYRPQEDEDDNDQEAKRILEILLTELPVKQASQLAAKITGLKKNFLYQIALEMKS
ncbi:tetrapyrrole methylase [Marinomonas sp. SBI22]|uniref:16S rRNA (cytidine(1402)-2'-O)-methyltransferase n=1 Tax=unclassified Marinomonas TaxID=196814 RepID=UPI0005F9C783|nr:MULTISPECIES: 16S rRNA (cytidine(1402)-2'-O)-methyltransferase [unclassified Marinomonas]KJZ14534.1 tetrapyrrole methylase [Marinomonas sp. S3726]KZM41642.1 tetrapyrrole methylase [Marinomonas sp. SBI22]KZM43478.1 tetrapyrrole methylase [Marinomonas sp. SBI8L]